MYIKLQDADALIEDGVCIYIYIYFSLIHIWMNEWMNVRKCYLNPRANTIKHLTHLSSLGGNQYAREDYIREIRRVHICASPTDTVTPRTDTTGLSQLTIYMALSLSLWPHSIFSNCSRSVLMLFANVCVHVHARACVCVHKSRQREDTETKGKYLMME